MNATEDAIDFARFCLRLVLPTTHTRVSSGHNVLAEEESPAVIHNQETVTDRIQQLRNQAREVRRILDLPPGYEEAVRGMREVEEDPPSYEAVSPPSASEETRAPPPPPDEVVSRESVHNEGDC